MTTLIVLAPMFASLHAGAQTQAPGGPVVELSATGVVDPFMASYLTSKIEDANDDSVSAILVIIDTPGGLGSSMREITQAILNSDVPVITYVSPSGARAASAGTFILMSGSVAAMAPGTNVGAAHPVGISGAVPQEKATNDAAASLVAIAQARDRSTEFAESAVKDSVSISAEQALEDDVIDLIAPDTAALLDEVDGMSVSVAGDQQVTLDTAGASVDEESMNPFIAFLHGLLSPDIAFIFFWLGLGLLILEIFVPGGVMGTIGAIMLVLAIVAFGMLPVQLLGVAFLFASVVFFIIELKHPGVGVPAIAGAICLILGGLTLFDRSVPNATVSPWVIALMAILVTTFFIYVVQAAIKMRRVPVAIDNDMTGMEAVVVKALDPAGTVRVKAEEWSAVAESYVAAGETVRITEVDGLELKVEPLTGQTAGTHPEEGN
jgi:membrane-bound serine protease (ClpP class)